MILYHGSPIPNLKELKPNICDHEKPYIYFATNPVVAAFYMVHILERPYSFYPYGFNEKGTPTYTEYYPNALADIYDKNQGYLYECFNVSDITNPTHINCAYTCENFVSVDKCTIIENVYDYFLECEKEEKLIIKRYETLKQKHFAFIEKYLVNLIKNNNLKDYPNSNISVFIKTKFQHIWNNT